MSVAENTKESTITSDALGLLDCFSEGVGDFIYYLAEHIADQRAGQSGAIEVDVDDMAKAAAMFVDYLRQSDAPPEAKRNIDRMLSCFSRKMNECK